MKTFLLLLFMSSCLLADAQYFRRYYNFDFATPKYRDEYFNSGIRTRANFAGGVATNYYFVGIGVSFNNTTLPAPDNKANRMRFVRNNKTGAMVNNNRGYEFRDNVTGAPYYNSAGNSIAEIKNSSGTGGYIAVGMVTDNSITGAAVPGGSDALYTNLNSSGMVVNANRIDFASGKDIAWCVRASAFTSGTWLICGQSTQAGTGGVSYTDCFVARLDASGSVLWCFTYNFDPTPAGGLSAHCIAKQLCEDPATGNIYVVGNITDVGPGPNTNGLAFALNSAGGFIGAASYDAGKIDQFEAVRFTIDGNLIVGGWTNFSPTGAIFGSNMLIVKLTPGGVILFQNMLRASDPAGTTKYDCKGYDLIERINTAGVQEYFLAGPMYDGFGGIGQLMYKTNAVGLGINNYQYDKMKYDIGFGIDDADNTFTKPGPVVYSSVASLTGSGFSDAHVLRTYYNGATCMNYCPANPPVDIAISLTVSGLQPFINQTCTQVKLKAKLSNYQSVLQCNQAMVGCGSNLKETDEVLTPNFKSQEELMVYPNPSDGELNLQIFIDKGGEYTIEVVDITGKTAFRINKQWEQGMVTEQLNAASLPKGIYVISVSNGYFSRRTTFVRE